MTFEDFKNTLDIVCEAYRTREPVYTEAGVGKDTVYRMNLGDDLLRVDYYPEYPSVDARLDGHYYDGFGDDLTEAIVTVLDDVPRKHLRKVFFHDFPTGDVTLPDPLPHTYEDFQAAITDFCNENGYPAPSFSTEKAAGRGKCPEYYATVSRVSFTYMKAAESPWLVVYTDLGYRSEQPVNNTSCLNLPQAIRDITESVHASFWLPTPPPLTFDEFGAIVRVVCAKHDTLDPKVEVLSDGTYMVSFDGGPIATGRDEATPVLLQVLGLQYRPAHKSINAGVNGERYVVPDGPEDATDDTSAARVASHLTQLLDLVPRKYSRFVFRS